MSAKENKSKQIIEQLRKDTRMMLQNKYFNIWMNSRDYEGLSRVQKRFLMKRWYYDGSIGCGKDKHLPELFFAPWNMQKVDMYGEPKEILFINLFNSSVIPKEEQEVGKDAVIGYVMSNRKGISYFVNYFVERMVELELILNVNVNLQNIPFLIALKDGVVSKNKAKDLIERILNHELAVFVDVNELQEVQSFTTNTPYICDKLRSIYYDYENQLYTILGIDNTKFDGSNKQFQLTEELDSNTIEINAYGEDIDTNIKDFFKEVNEVLGIEIKVINKLQKATDKQTESDEGEEEDEENA